MGGKLYERVVSILIDPRSSYSNVNLDLVDKRGLSKEVHAESWLVQLATRTKKRVHHWVTAFSFELNAMHTSTHLNVLPLGLYNIILGMDWLYLDRTKVDFYEKAIECLDDEGEKKILHVHISSDKGNDIEDAKVLKRYLVLQQFAFPIDISEFLPHREVEFSIELC
eukprot:PITA_11025